MTAEDRLKALIGDLHFQLAFLVTEAEKIKKELDDLKAKEPKPDAA